MQEITVASKPLLGLRIERNQSRLVFKWLRWYNRQLLDAVENITEKEREHHYMRHSGNKGEYKIPDSSYTVDG